MNGFFFFYKKGTSLVELIAVIVIMGIIAGIAIPTTIAVINRQKKNAALKSAENVFSAAKNVLLEASANTGSALITDVETTGVCKSNNEYTVTEAALVALGELEQKASEGGSVTFKLTSSGTAETGGNTFSVTCTTWKINGYFIDWQAASGTTPGKLIIASNQNQGE